MGTPTRDLNEGVVSEGQIVARIERLPLKGWYPSTMLIVGQAGFFDSFNALTITFVLPVLAGLWQLEPSAIGLLVSSGYVGQTIGAIWLSRVSENVGRLRIIRWSVVIMGVFSLASALSWNYAAMLVFRFLQGVGLGAEVPVAATYMNELTRAEFRGRLVMLFQLIFAIGIFVASAVSIWAVPDLGWRSMFFMGTLPAVLGLWLLNFVPESPRWLAAHHRADEADAALKTIEARAAKAAGGTLPPVSGSVPTIVHEKPRFASLFHGVYLGRTLTLWALAFLVAMVGYGINVWMPTLYRTVYHLPLRETLIYSLSIAVVGIFGALFGWMLIDRFGRRPTFMLSFLGSGIALLTLAAGIGAGNVTTVMLLTATALFFISLMLSGLFVYFPENYPTRMRAMGAGLASAWMRIGTIVMPIIVGEILQYTDVADVYLLLGGSAILGALIVAFFVIETKGRLLEEIAA